jgi:hypothetical protein
MYLHDSIGQVLALTTLQIMRIQDALRLPVDPDNEYDEGRVSYFTP